MKEMVGRIILGLFLFIHACSLHNPNYKSYVNLVIYQIEKSLPATELKKAMGEKAEVRVVVEIMITREGELRGLSMMQSSRQSSFDSLIFSTLEKAAPFAPPPPELFKEEMDFIALTWRYELKN